MMRFSMPVLPYPFDALEPVISGKTMEFHYGKHLQTYLDNLNKFIDGTSYESDTIERIIKQTLDGPIYNNAAQVLNHTLFFEQFSPHPVSNVPKVELKKAIDAKFSSFDLFKEEFTAASVGLFGSGWVWLASDKTGAVSIFKGSNAANPLTKDLTPLFCFDVWEHAYYLDYQNKRADYIKALWNILNWEVIEKRYLSK